MLVRFIAVALIGFGLIEFSLSWLARATHHEPMRLVDFVLPAVLFALGTVGLAKAKSLAAWMSDKLDQ